MLSSRRLVAAIRLLAAVAAALALGACGGSEGEEAADPEQSSRAQAVQTIGSGEIGVKGESGAGGEEGPEDPCAEAPCNGPVYRRGGRVVLCGQLELRRVPVFAPEAVTEQPPAVESVPSSTPQVEEEEEEEEKVVVGDVIRPRCLPGTQELTVVGLDFDALESVEASSDGEAAWTTKEIEIRGRIVDGTLVVAE